MQTQSPRRELTGKKVLAMLVAFFAVVAAVNVVMMRAAISTFGGLEAGDAYRAGLAFNQTIAAAADQDARHWTVDAHVAHRTAEIVDVSVKLREASGLPPRSVAVKAVLAHPASARFDRVVALHEAAPGAFVGETDAPPGQWDLLLDVSRGDEPLFHSKNRITLR